MGLSFSDKDGKSVVFSAVADHLKEKGLKVINKDDQRPWGGFFVIDEEQAERFIDTYFPDLNKEELLNGNKLSPKILVVQPQKRLSWQYHDRRKEVWKVIGGEAGVVRSMTDEETPLQTLYINKPIELKIGERHRLVGLNSWGIVAEIWQHTDKSAPSDENDIVRLQDDFGR